VDRVASASCSVSPTRAVVVTYVAKASSEEVSQVIPTSGSGEWGLAVDDFFSPDTGSVGILLINDTGAFSNDDDNAFWDFQVRPALFGK
jgi:hypothetical protein